MNPLILLLRAYQTISRALAAQGLVTPLSGCRQWPTCSEYAVNAIRTRGTVQGTKLAVRRLARCHPWTNT